MIFVTGGAGFIGSNFIINWLAGIGEPVVNLDKLTYAGNMHNLSSLASDFRHIFVHGDIADSNLIQSLFARYKPRAILNFAAESHVDRSIHDPACFVKTNVQGTFQLLEAARHYWQGLTKQQADQFRFLQVSTDEVYGTLAKDAPAFSETTAYAPNSPYSASKAAADHLVRAYFHTYGLPTLTTNCSNNYGRFQFPEKLIPLMILNAISGKPLPVYGDGLNIRDWLHVEDHCDAIRLVLAKGRPGEAYNIGGNCEKTNIEVVEKICIVLDAMLPPLNGKTYGDLITFVKDRLGHDRRYAIDATKIARELNWVPKHNFETGLQETVGWYLQNMDWVEKVKSGAYMDWLKLHYQTKSVEA